MSSGGKKNPLQKVLETEKFLHGAAYVQNTSAGLKKLTINELAYLNQLVGSHSDDPWRFEAAEVTIPTGKKLQMNVISNPLSRARDIIGDAYQLGGNQDVISSCAYIYSHLVIEHLFQDANRRTAVLAAYWMLLDQGWTANPEELLKVPVGDLRDKTDADALFLAIKILAKKN